MVELNIDKLNKSIFATVVTFLPVYVADFALIHPSQFKIVAIAFLDSTTTDPNTFSIEFILSVF